MTAPDNAAALQRVETMLQRRPDLGLHDDAPATARWTGGTRIAASHANGTEVLTDMPAQLGGTGDRITPGWLFRAGLASCAATSIALAAARAGIELKTLELRASSRSDTRGLLGMEGDDGQLVQPAPSDMQLHVRISANGVSEHHLRALVEAGCQCSPIPCAVTQAVPVTLRIEVDAA